MVLPNCDLLELLEEDPENGRGRPARHQRVGGLISADAVNEV